MSKLIVFVFILSKYCVKIHSLFISRSLSSRAVKLAEKINLNFVLKYYQYSNLKGVISV